MNTTTFLMLVILGLMAITGLWLIVELIIAAQELVRSGHTWEDDE